MPHTSSYRLVAVALFFVCSLAAEGGMQHRVEAGVMAPLESPVPEGETIRVDGVPLTDGEPATLELERFEVWAVEAEILVFGADGTVLERLPVPAIQYFRGRVAGEPDSLVFLSRAGENVEGLIYTADRKFAVGSRRLVRGSMETELVIEESSVLDDFPTDGTFTCDLDQTGIASASAGALRPHAVTNAFGLPVANAAPTGTQRSLLHLAIETDYELFTRSDSVAGNVTTFIGNLIGAASTIYERDLLTELRLSYLSIYTTSSDPFSVVPGVNGTSVDAMNELGNRWQTSPPTNAVRSAVSLVSGKSQMSGVAWVNTLCNPSYYFSYNGGIDPPSSLAVPDPNSPGYAVPSSNYWPLLQFTHELGHNVGSSHTHCVSLTSSQKSQYGVTRDWVDVCSTSGSGCNAGSTSVPAEKGTIMSYCHLIGGGSSTRFTFGQPNETSEVIRTNMRSYMASRTPDLSAISTPSTVSIGTSATASVTNLGHSYAWRIVNGTFAGGSTTASGASVTFVPSASPVTLTVIATNSNGCAITDRKVLSLDSVTLTAPASITATAASATSVAVSWPAVANATGYQVHRSSGGGTFTQVGTPAGTSFTDSTASAGTAYLYRVRATASGSTGPFSVVDLATTVMFTDPTLTAGISTPKDEHFTQLLTAVNAVRRLGGLATVSFASPAPAAGVTVRQAHLDTLRTALNQARSALSLPTLSYATEATIRAAHVTQLRGGVR